MIRVIPPQGAAHPIFAGMDDLDAIEVFYAYRPDDTRPALSEKQGHAWHDALRDACTAIAGQHVAMIATWNSTATRLVFPKVPRHPDVLERIIARAADYPVPVNQVIIRRGVANRHAELTTTQQDPRAPREVHAPPRSNQELWDGTFTHVTPPFASVAEDISLMIGRNAIGGMVPEMRLADPFHPGVRIGGYLGEIEKVEPLPGDARAESLARALLAAIERHWPEGAARPRIVNRQSHDPTYLDRISWLGRQGFAFAARRDTETLVQPLVDALRMREDELIAAAIDVILAENLYPALNWEREDRIIIFNLWER